jgi:Fe-S cluster assembly iron-binding protein IscA
MALDEPNDSDQIFEVDGFTYLVDKQLLAEAQSIMVDFKTIGFYITGNSTNRNRQCRC